MTIFEGSNDSVDNNNWIWQVGSDILPQIF